MSLLINSAIQNEHNSLKHGRRIIALEVLNSQKRKEGPGNEAISKQSRCS